MCFKRELKHCLQVGLPRRACSLQGEATCQRHVAGASAQRAAPQWGPPAAEVRETPDARRVRARDAQRPLFRQCGKPTALHEDNQCLAGKSEAAARAKTQTNNVSESRFIAAASQSVCQATGDSLFREFTRLKSAPLLWLVTSCSASPSRSARPHGPP